MTDTIKHFDAPDNPAWPLLRLLSWLFVAVAAILLCLGWWGGNLLIASDPLPAHVDAAIVLRGSISGEMARVAGAMQLAQQGVAGRVLLSVPNRSYWGQSIRPAARSFIEKKYGNESASRVDFCETGPDVNSTEDEARALSHCIEEHGWQTVAVVTSNYHTRRARNIWRKTLRKQNPSVRLWMHGVPDPEFHPRGWWRERLSAKTWFMEFVKLVWSRLFR
jgi:uncharacterized SAM-binding protein YcdF (DUF218 family)